MFQDTVLQQLAKESLDLNHLNSKSQNVKYTALTIAPEGIVGEDSSMSEKLAGVLNDYLFQSNATPELQNFKVSVDPVQSVIVSETRTDECLD